MIADSLIPIRSFDDLLAPMHEAIKPASAYRIGTEAEKQGVVLATGKPVRFSETIKPLLEALVARGWTPEREHDDGPVISLRRDGGSITLEPGGQLELSGAPLRTLHETQGEIGDHFAEIRALSEPRGVAWLGLGFHPFASREDYEWVPKFRYPVMRRYLPTRGGHAVDMMLRTATVQANYDFSSEEDAIRKLRVGLALSPIGTAMFANSPIAEGKITGERSRRAAVWLDVDPDRSGLLPFVWEDGMSFRRYAEWALDVPMFLVKRGATILNNEGQTFRDFLARGFQGQHATASDWETHLNTLFPEVRLKRTIEVRGADAQDAALTAALPALWTGIFYDEVALSKAEALASRFAPDELLAVRPEIGRLGMNAKLAGREIAVYAAELLEIARGGLQRRAFVDASGRDESVHLDALSALVSKGQSPADALVRAIDPNAPLLPQLLSLVRVA